jgi:glycosyltransferase involved in cell wall biosynthesis
MVVNLMTHLERERFDVAAVVLSHAEGGPLERDLKEAGFDVRYLGKSGALDPATLFRIRDTVRRLRPQIVHSHLSLHYVFPALAGCRSVRHVTTVHLPGDTSYTRVVMPLSRLAFRRGVMPIAVSDDVAKWVQRVCKVDTCPVIPNGIPIAGYQRHVRSRSAWRAEHGLRREDIAFVCVARLEKQKNHAMLLDAFARVHATDARARLLLVGDGACRHALELRASELALERKVRFLGQRDDVPRVLAAADAFVLASCNEGNPLSAMEAMAAGLPVVATAVGGVPELVTNGKSGLLVSPGDCEGLASAMLRLSRDDELRRSMARSSAAHASQAFSADRMARAYMNAYERIAGGDAAMTAECRIEMATH